MYWCNMSWIVWIQVWYMWAAANLKETNTLCSHACVATWWPTPFQARLVLLNVIRHCPQGYYMSNICDRSISYSAVCTYTQNISQPRTPCFFQPHPASKSRSSQPSVRKSLCNILVAMIEPCWKYEGQRPPIRPWEVQVRVDQSEPESLKQEQTIEFENA